MKNTFRKLLALTSFALIAGSLSSCGKRHRIEFWSSFGASYTTYLDDIVGRINEAHPSFDVGHKSKGSYDNIFKQTVSAIAKKKYPDILTGYPDHFATYQKNKLLIPLDSYIDAYNQAHGVNLLDDYYDDYMKENMRIDVDNEGNPVISALPFNKSTELMGYNGTFVSFCKEYAEHFGKTGEAWEDLDVPPATWQEWVVKGPSYREILTYLCLETDELQKPVKNGRILWAIQEEDGTSHDFCVTEKNTSGVDTVVWGEKTEEKVALLNFEDVNSKDTRVISWDSTDNMFITLVRQWGGEYTKLPDSELIKPAQKREGHIRFASSENKPKTIECLNFFNELNKKNIFGVPSLLGGASYSSDAFAVNKVMFMLCSSGGLSYNTTKWENRFTVAPLPYYDDGNGNVHKYVISQGADITMTKYGQKQDTFADSFETMVELTTGENQAEWCIQTGYYPCSYSASGFVKQGDDWVANPDHPYQKFLSSKDYSIPAQVAYREGSVVNQEFYMNEDEGWEKFVDDAFIGSSDIRVAVKTIFLNVFTGDKTPEQAIEDVCQQFERDTSTKVKVDRD